MLVNPLENQIINLKSFVFEKDITIKTVGSVGEGAFICALPMDVIREITKYADFDTSKILLGVSKRINNFRSLCLCVSVSLCRIIYLHP